MVESIASEVDKLLPPKKPEKPKKGEVPVNLKLEWEKTFLPFIREAMAQENPANYIETRMKEKAVAERIAKVLEGKNFDGLVYGLAALLVARKPKNTSEAEKVAHGELEEVLVNGWENGVGKGTITVLARANRSWDIMKKMSRWIKSIEVDPEGKGEEEETLLGLHTILLFMESQKDNPYLETVGKVLGTDFKGAVENYIGDRKELIRSKLIELHLPKVRAMEAEINQQIPQASPPAKLEEKPKTKADKLLGLDEAVPQPTRQLPASHPAPTEPAQVVRPVKEEEPKKRFTKAEKLLGQTEKLTPSTHDKPAPAKPTPAQPVQAKSNADKVPDASKASQKAPPTTQQQPTPVKLDSAAHLAAYNESRSKELLYNFRQELSNVRTKQQAIQEEINSFDQKKYERLKAVQDFFKNPKPDMNAFWSNYRSQDEFDRLISDLGGGKKEQPEDWEKELRDHHATRFTGVSSRLLGWVRSDAAVNEQLKQKSKEAFAPLEATQALKTSVDQTKVSEHLGTIEARLNGIERREILGKTLFSLRDRSKNAGLRQEVEKDISDILTKLEGGEATIESLRKIQKELDLLVQLSGVDNAAKLKERFNGVVEKMIKELIPAGEKIPERVEKISYLSELMKAAKSDVTDIQKDLALIKFTKNFVNTHEKTWGHKFLCRFSSSYDQWFKGLKAAADLADSKQASEGINKALQTTKSTRAYISKFHKEMENLKPDKKDKSLDEGETISRKPP